MQHYSDTTTCQLTLLDFFVKREWRVFCHFELIVTSMNVEYSAGPGCELGRVVTWQTEWLIAMETLSLWIVNNSAFIYIAPLKPQHIENTTVKWKMRGTNLLFIKSEGDTSSLFPNTKAKIILFTFGFYNYFDTWPSSLHLSVKLVQVPPPPLLGCLCLLTVQYIY